MAAIGAVLSVAELVLIYGLVGAKLQQSEGFVIDASIIVAGLVAMLAAFVIVTNVMVRRFVAPLNEVVDSVKAACEGEIGRKVEIKTEDEIGTLAMSYNQLLDLIVYLIRQTHESSRRLAQSSSEILAATEQQASGSAEQAASIAETTATMEELASTYRQIAENADQVVTMAEASLGSAEFRAAGGAQHADGDGGHQVPDADEREQDPGAGRAKPADQPGTLRSSTRSPTRPRSSRSTPPSRPRAPVTPARGSRWSPSRFASLPSRWSTRRARYRAS